MGISVEYTAHNTLQQNVVIERAFATHYRRTRVACMAAGLSDNLRKSLWAEGVDMATKLNNGKIMR